jgi:spore coat polysaccharide biosynthesis predicted glycosyltransferase SpsG
MKRATADQTILEIVAEGGHGIGFGHLGRCLAVAEELGAQATFALDDAGARFVRDHGARTGACPAAPVVLLDRRRPTSVREVRALAAAGRQVALLDDLGAGRAEADLVIDPPTAVAWPPTPAPRLTGFEHVLLRREVRAARRSARSRGALVAMGGSDPTHATSALVHALHAAGIEVTANLGPGYAGERPAVGRILERAAGFIEALAETELLIASYGHTVLEAAHLGVPTIVVVVLPPHRSHAEAFCGHGTATMLDASERLEPQAVARLAVELLGDPARRHEMAARGRALIDGRGAERVADAIRAMLTSVRA